MKANCEVKSYDKKANDNDERKNDRGNVSSRDWSFYTNQTANIKD